MLSYAFHTYHTIIRTFTGATPYSLVYGMEVFIPLKVEIPTLKVLMNAKLEEYEWAKLKFEQLNLINEKRLATICHHQLYQSRMTKAYNKKVRSRLFKEGDLIFVVTYFLPKNINKRKIEKRKSKNIIEYIWRKPRRFVKLVMKDQKDKQKIQRNQNVQN